MGSYSLISYNILFGKKVDKIFAWLKTLNNTPDFICFQEFPQNAINEIKTNLSKIANYDLAFAPSFRYKNLQYGELTVYNCDKFNLTESITLALSSDLRLQKIIRVSGQRTALLTTFKIDDVKFTLANIHLPWLCRNTVRLKALAGIMAKLEENQPSLIVGDYNYSNIFDNTGLYELMAKNHFIPGGGYFITNSLFGLVNQQLDYAFARNSEAKIVNVAKLDYSDHYPLFLDIKM